MDKDIKQIVDLLSQSDHALIVAVKNVLAEMIAEARKDKKNNL